MSIKKILERSYFCIADGGLTLSVIERTDVRKDCAVYPPDWHEGLRSGKYQLKLGPEQVGTILPTEDRHNRSWRFRVDMSCYGSNTRFDFPITPLMVKWTIAALNRVLVRMETPTGLPHDVRDWGLDGNRNVLVHDIDGHKADGAERYFPEKTEAELEAQKVMQSQGPQTQMEDPPTENS